MITTVQCSICSQLNNMPRVVVTDFRLRHTCSLIIVWLHSLSGVIRSLLCNPHAFSPAITRNNTFPVHHSMATCTHKIRSKLNFMLKHQNRIFYCHSALLLFSHIIFIACSVVLVEQNPVFLMVKKVECSLQSLQWTEHTCNQAVMCTQLVQKANQRKRS